MHSVMFNGQNTGDTLQTFTTEYDKGSVQGLMTKHVCHHCYVLFLLQPCGEALIAWHARASAEVEGAQILGPSCLAGCEAGCMGWLGVKSGWLAGWLAGHTFLVRCAG